MEKTGCTGELGERSIFQYFSSLVWLISHRGTSTNLWHQDFSLTLTANSEPHFLREPHSAPEPWPCWQLTHPRWLLLPFRLTAGPHPPGAQHRTGKSSVLSSVLKQRRAQHNHQGKLVTSHCASDSRVLPRVLCQEGAWQEASANRNDILLEARCFSGQGG